MIPRFAIVLATCVAASMLLAGCANGQRTISVGEHTVYVHGDALLPRGGEDALIEGKLVIRDDCVLLEQGEVALPTIWPSGTRIAQESPFILRLPSGEYLEVGQRVSGGGGYHPSSSEQVDVDIDSSCLVHAEPGTDSVVVFNPDGQLTIQPGQ